MKLAGHLVRHPEEAAHEVVLREPLHGNSKRGAPEMNYVKLMRKDTGLEEAAEIKTAMMDREAGETGLVGPPVLRPGEVSEINII